MGTRTRRHVVLCTALLCISSLGTAAAADESRPVASPGDPGLGSQVLSDEALASIRGRYVPPPGSTVTVQIGNGDNTSTTYTQRDPATPGSATVITTGSTMVTAQASTGIGTSSTPVSRTFTIARSFGAHY